MRNVPTYRSFLSTPVSAAILLACFLIALSPVWGDSLSGLKWVASDEAFKFQITTTKPVRFSIVDERSTRGVFHVDVLDIDHAYEKRAIDSEDPRLNSITIQYDENRNRLRFSFAPQKGVKWDVRTADSLNELLIILEKPGKPGKIKASARSLNYDKRRKVSDQKSPSKNPFPSPAGKKLVIIDPGHGGLNKGGSTFWKINGKHYYEKDITLKIARKLKYLIDKSGNLKAVMTRSNDKYVSLGKRVEFAQEIQGDIFVSIHTNAAPSHRSASARGVEFFHWKETGSQDAALNYLENLENDQLLPNLPRTEDQNLKKILTSMLEDALEEEKILSKKLCEEMWESFQKSPYFKKYHRKPPVKSARFVVLANYSMPSILIEVGFLTHKTEGRYLISESFQWTTARLIYNGIQRFFAEDNHDFKPEYVKF